MTSGLLPCDSTCDVFLQEHWELGTGNQRNPRHSQSFEGDERDEGDERGKVSEVGEEDEGRNEGGEGCIIPRSIVTGASPWRITL